MLQDITDRKKAEEQIRESNVRLEAALAELKKTQQRVIQQERLRALGELASGIAHDFNNVLMPLMGYSELLLNAPRILEDKEKMRGYLELMNTAAEDAKNIVSRLREFYRPREDGELFASIDLNSLIQEVVQLTRPKWKSQAQSNGITVNVKTDLKDIPQIDGNRSELREVLTNLVLNAVDAMPEGGTVAIHTRTDDGTAVIHVSDTGVGMTEEVKQRCFEPFFSTKGDAGTGLGLSIVYGIVRRHRGSIQIESELDRGTDFIIRLPKAEMGDMQVSHESEAYPEPLHVLVVDDEPATQNIVAEYLRLDGHTYEIATDGREGLEKFGQDRFDVVITDRAMPDIGGIQLANLIKHIAPNTPVIMLTGFGDMMQASGEMPEDVDWVISKPITLRKFREAIAKAITKYSEL
jgi:nitrogen-specific signal transduction histidine kinase/CheY-like chemotaxis protein